MILIRQITRLFLLVIWTITLFVIFLISKLVPFYDSQRIPRLYHAGVCRIVGLSVEFKGEMTEHVPTIFVANHISYIDIFAIGQKVKASFVAKSEIASWPVLGYLAKFQNTLFIERSASRAKYQLKQLQGYLSSQQSLILFPEGTSTNGAEVKTFKSSLFAAGDAADVLIQPVSIVYTECNGQGMSQADRDYFAWYAEMPFGSHFFAMLGRGRFNAVIEFHKPMQINGFENRKQCANYAESLVRKSLNSELKESNSAYEHT